MNALYRMIDSLWQWIAERVFVRFEFEMPVEALKTRLQQGPIFFSLTSGGLVEWLILSSWCRREGLEPILITNNLALQLLGKPALFFSLLFRKRSWASTFLDKNTQGIRLIFCRQDERRRPFTPTRLELLLSQIYKEGLASGVTPAIAVAPVVITWRKHIRGAGRNLSEYLFGLSSRPNLVGKMWYLIRRRKDSTVKGLSPFLIIESGTTSAGDLGEDEGMRIAKSARRRILIATNEEMRIKLGPRYVSPTAVKETILHDPEVQALLDELSREQGVEKRKLMLRAYQNLTELVANYTYRLDYREEELDKLKETLKQKPAVFISAHRSHFDYMVVPYLLFLQDIVTPHIVAGVNLSFWPVGGLLRRAGAFFIQRSFRGDRLYSTLLKKYVAFLIQNRFNILFFLEGTRSRTGKMLPPTYGMLKMVLETFQNRLCDDIALFPISISYDEVLEQKSYAKELAGGQKEKEGARALIRSRSVLGRNIGKVYVRLGEAVSAKEIFRAAGEANIDERRLLQKTAFDLSARINSVTPITPKSILVTILLGQSEPVTLEQITHVASKLDSYARHFGHPVTLPDADFSRRAIESLLRDFHRTGIVNTIEGSLPLSFETDRDRRSSLVFYRNNAVHCFVVSSIAVLSLLYEEKFVTHPGVDEQSVFRTALKLRNLFKFDFFFAASPAFMEEVDRSLAYISNHDDWKQLPIRNVVRATSDHFGKEAGKRVMRALLGDLIESYHTAFGFMKKNASLHLDKKALLQRVLKEGQQLLTDEKLGFPESVSLQNYGCALQLAENLGVATSSAEGPKPQIRISPWTENAEQTLQLLDHLKELSTI
ncbi:MAG: 1-acyl-sn-glycerol-3-phosphate acyltransferase [Deltaproteobacteria bacterium]|nr:1-acyl-sn-glycerol-3-phosphate acyltransferase [Deltaproteobacteria bacterium]